APMSGKSSRRNAANARRFRPGAEPLEGRELLATLPPGFTESFVATNLNFPTAMERAPDGRIFIAEKGGTVQVIDNGQVVGMTVLTVPVATDDEQGLVGITVDPNFATNHFLYIYYTVPGSPAHNRVSRFTLNGDVAVPGSEVPILNLE